MTHDQLEAAVPIYAAGALERVERQALEAHLLTGCIPCRTTLKEYQLVAVTLPFGLTITPPPRALKGKILSSLVSPPAIESETQSPSQPSLQPGEWMNHLFPPSSPPATSFGWALGTVIFVVLIHPGVFWMELLHPHDRRHGRSWLSCSLQAEEAGAQLAILQQQLSERARTHSPRPEKNSNAARLNWQRLRDQLIQREARARRAESPSWFWNSGRSPATSPSHAI